MQQKINEISQAPAIHKQYHNQLAFSPINRWGLMFFLTVFTTLKTDNDD